MKARALPILIAILLGGCDRADMVAQDKSRTWDKSTFFPDGSTMREPVPGTLARDQPGQSAPQPDVITADLLARGSDRYGIFCSPCHGLAGDGRGMIVERGFPHPPPFGIDRLRNAKAAYLYDVITHGHGAMYPYGDRVASADRWAVIAYVRALQQSQGVEADNLAPEDRMALEAKP